MTRRSLHSSNGHLFVELEGDLWLFDTGAPASFGDGSPVKLENENVPVGDEYMGLTAGELSRLVGVACRGLLGTDVLGRYDFILDVAGGAVEVSTDELEHLGTSVRLEEFMGIPIVAGRVLDSDRRFFFDTGAQVSYLQDDATRGSFPSAGAITDFYPGVGEFETDLNAVELSLGGLPFTIRCGALPGLLGMTLMMAGTQGIIGNEVLSDRVAGYFPRRGLLVL